MTHGYLPLPLWGRIFGVADSLLFALVRQNSSFKFIVVDFDLQNVWESIYYPLNMLSKYGMTSCKPIYVQLEQNVKLNVEKGELPKDVIV